MRMGGDDLDLVSAIPQPVRPHRADDADAVGSGSSCSSTAESSAVRVRPSPPPLQESAAGPPRRQPIGASAETWL